MSNLKLKVATYNIHRCFGIDKKHDPDRIIDVIKELDADVIGLQEVDSGIFVKNGGCQADLIAERTGYHIVKGPTIRLQTARYGNVMLSRWPVAESRLIDLGIRFREPRGAIFAAVRVGDSILGCVNVHLGLNTFERKLQYRRLAMALRDISLPIIYMGDFNEWSPVKKSLPTLGFSKWQGALVRSFPAWRPILPLDRIYVEPHEAIKQIVVHKTNLSLKASDHLPVHAVIELPAFPIKEDVNHVNREGINFAAS